MPQAIPFVTVTLSHPLVAAQLCGWHTCLDSHLPILYI